MLKEQFDSCQQKLVIFHYGSNNEKKSKHLRNPDAALGGSKLPTSLDSSLEKTYTFYVLKERGYSSA